MVLGTHYWKMECLGSLCARESNSFVNKIHYVAVRTFVNFSWRLKDIYSCYGIILKYSKAS